MFTLARVLSDGAVVCRRASPLRLFSAKSSTGRENNKEPSVTSAAAMPPGDYKAVDLSYAAFECKPREGEKQKVPLVILHSLMGRKKNWKTVAKVRRRSLLSTSTNGFNYLISGNQPRDPPQGGLRGRPQPRGQPAHAGHVLLADSQGHDSPLQTTSDGQNQLHG